MNTSEWLQSFPTFPSRDNDIDQLTLPSRAYDSIVVGAGLAGLSASEMLRELGKDFILLEARSDGGGRIVHSAKSTALHPAMIELGAYFVYDRETAQRLTAAGAIVQEFPKENFFEVHNGQINRMSAEDNVLVHAEAVAHELSDLNKFPKNISIDQALKVSQAFQSLSQNHQKIVRAYFDADIGGDPRYVGISSLRYDAQTLGIEKEFFGVCTIGGFSTLTRAMINQLPDDAMKLGRLIKYVTVSNDGAIWIYSHGAPKKGVRVREQHFHKANSAILTLPLSALMNLESFSLDSGNTFPLRQRFKPEVQRALEMFDTAKIVKISFKMTQRPIAGVDMGYIAAVPPESGAIRSGELWLLPPPREDEQTPTGTEQVGMIYLGGSQAEIFINFLKEINGDTYAIDQAVSEYLHETIGIDPNLVIGHAEIAQWIPNPNNPSGRFGYTYIKADNRDADYNPRAEFDQSVIEDADLFLAGEGYTAFKSTLTIGAIKSGEKMAKLVS